MSTTAIQPTSEHPPAIRSLTIHPLYDANAFRQIVEHAPEAFVLLASLHKHHKDERLSELPVSQPPRKAKKHPSSFRSTHTYAFVMGPSAIDRLNAMLLFIPQKKFDLQTELKPDHNISLVNSFY